MLKFRGDLIDLAKFNGKLLSKLYYNGILIWPDSKWAVYYKYINLEHIKELGIEELTYELHLSSIPYSGYKLAPLNVDTPKWQEAQEDVVGPDGNPYTSPMAFVRRVVIDNALMPISVTNWFNHLYGGLNNREEIVEKYPFEWVNFKNLNIEKTSTLKSAFSRCHAPKIDISHWDVKHITDMTEMFNCSSTRHIYVGNKWSVNQVTKSNKMFFECLYLHNYKSNWQDKTKAIIDEYNNGGYLERK